MGYTILLQVYESFVVFRIWSPNGGSWHNPVNVLEAAPSILYKTSLLPIFYNDTHQFYRRFCWVSFFLFAFFRYLATAWQGFQESLWQRTDRRQRRCLVTTRIRPVTTASGACCGTRTQTYVMVDPRNRLSKAGVQPGTLQVPAHLGRQGSPVPGLGHQWSVDHGSWTGTHGEWRTGLLGRNWESMWCRESFHQLGFLVLWLRNFFLGRQNDKRSWYYRGKQWHSEARFAALPVLQWGMGAGAYRRTGCDETVCGSHIRDEGELWDCHGFPHRSDEEAVCVGGPWGATLDATALEEQELDPWTLWNSADHENSVTKRPR